MKRTLLPYPASASAPSGLSRQSQGAAGSRRNVAAACERCRATKQKCTGEKPKCQKCVRRGKDCIYRTPIKNAEAIAAIQQYSNVRGHYEELQKSHTTLERVVRAMRSGDNEHATAIFQMLRQGRSLESIEKQIGVGDALIELHLSTETKYRFDFPYRKQMPREILLSNSPYLRSLMYEAANATTPTAGPHSAPDAALLDQYKPQYLKPYQAAKIMDPRLSSVLPSQWTNVSKDDVLMRDLLHTFFLHEYPWYSFFHIDHFLEDMVSGANDYCSALLVNVILALACSCNVRFQDRSEFWNPEKLAYKYLAEAKRLWELETNSKARLTTIQSGALLNIIYNMQSMDVLGTTYTLQAIAMAQDLGIFKDSTNTRSKKARVSFAFTAWSLFNWTSLQQYHFMKSPILETAPDYPLPNPAADAAWYGELILLYPPNQQSCQLHFGHFFKAKSELAVILSYITAKLWGNHAVSDSGLVGFVDDVSNKLEEWSKTLPAPLLPAAIVFPTQLKLHLLFYNVVMNLHNLIAAKAERFATHARLAMSRNLLNHATLNFEILLRLYFLRHGYNCSDTYLTHTLATLAFASIGRLNSYSESNDSSGGPDEIRSTIFLTAKGLVDQGKSHYIPYTIFEVIKRQLHAEDVTTLLGLLDTRDAVPASSQLRTEHIQAQYPINILDMTNHPEQNRLGNMIKNFSTIALEAQSPAVNAND